MTDEKTITKSITYEENNWTGKYRVITTLLNARSKPEFDAEVIKHLHYGLEVRVDEVNDEGWAKITEDGQDESYYCRAEYLQKIGEDDE